MSARQQRHVQPRPFPPPCDYYGNPRRPLTAVEPDDSVESHPATRSLLQHLERPAPPPSEVRRENRIPRIPAPPPGGTVISLHAYRRHSAAVAAALIVAAAMAAAWWFGR
jgi:hypothetical protein